MNQGEEYVQYQQLTHLVHVLLLLKLQESCLVPLLYVISFIEQFQGVQIVEGPL